MFKGNELFMFVINNSLIDKNPRNSLKHVIRPGQLYGYECREFGGRGDIQ